MPAKIQAKKTMKKPQKSKKAAPAKAKKAAKRRPAAKARPVAKPRAAAKPTPKAKPKPAAARSAARRVKPAAARPAKKAAVRAAKPAPRVAAKAPVRPAKKPVVPAKLAAKTPAAVVSPAVERSGAKRTPTHRGGTSAPKAKPAAATAPAPAIDPETFVFYRHKLMAKRDELLALYRKDLQVGLESSDEPTEDIVDRANNSYSRELTFSLSNGERMLLMQIDEALKRIGEGSFGNCAHCSKPIAKLRLEALPWARLCIECQELLERGLLSEG